MNLTVSRIALLQGSTRPPSDKSLTHRALLLASKARTPSRITNALSGEDCRATASCLRLLGNSVDWRDQEVTFTPKPWTAPDRPLDCGNSGTTMRLLSGLLAWHSFESILDGDDSLRRRPMGRIAEPLRRMGATVLGDKPPITIRGARDLKPIHYASPVASAQVKSCVLLAGLGAEGETWVTEPSLSRDHTERMLKVLGVRLLRNAEQPLAVGVVGGSEWDGFDMDVPADISSAAFFMVAACLLPESRVEFLGINTNPTRTGILDVFEEVGAKIARANIGEELGEPRADLHVSYQPNLRPFTIEGDLVPRLVDEIPVLAVLATQCDGWSEIRDARELRVKESDRIEKVADGLRAMGAEVETFEDGMRIAGPCNLAGCPIDASGDHRIAMAFAVAGLIATGSTTIHGADAISTSYPGFEEELCRLAVV